LQEDSQLKSEVIQALGSNPVTQGGVYFHPLRGKHLQSAVDKIEAERSEVDYVLSSGVLGRTNNHVRLLTYVCEKYFEGAIGEIKEYNIAVNALGRREAFDPQVDTIVRVTAHALRKRLEDYYRSGGAEHAVHICLPPGHYIPKFVHTTDLETATLGSILDESHNGQSLTAAPPRQNGQHLQDHPATVVLENEPERIAEPRKGADFQIKSWPMIVAVILLIAGLASFFVRKQWNRSQTPVPAALMNTSGKILRVMVGNTARYMDRGGSSWESDHFCTGGTSFSVAGHAIQGTEDPSLFSSGRRGVLHCNFPVAPGTYEVHLLFAETSGLQEASRNVAFSINGGQLTNLDVVDDAGGDDIATTKIFAGIAPANDGNIHVDFTSPESFVNAIEILPAPSHAMLPARIVVGHSPYLDSNGNIWMPDRYFFGGRLSSFGGDLSKVPDGRLYEWHRFGHFHYVVPVAAGGKYTVKLYFMEHWFGVQNGGIGGVGSRVFDIFCNGSTLLKGFDIFREAGSKPLVKTFQHVEPTPQGKVELYFTPDANYPSISAIEIIPE